MFMTNDNLNRGAIRRVSGNTKIMESCRYPGTLIACEDFVLTKLALTVSEMLDEALEPLDLRLRHYRLLVLLEAEGERAQSSIGAALGIDRTSVVATVDHLERLGAVKRQRYEDRRAYFVGVTPKGRKLARKAVANVSAAEARIYAPLSPAERETLRKLSAQVLLTVDPRLTAER
jgi:DNA-binding MarR family transcriptional regulator